jgi:tetratricopeptide (TPR) repeat protein
MASVFLSYDREDGDRARPIAMALEKAGHSVFWDLHIRGGAQFSKVIEEALKAADAVVVLWSKQSVESAWVRDEAAAGRDRGCLIPILLDQITPPMGFRQYQTIDLSGWKGRSASAGLKEVLLSIDALGGSAVPQAAISTTSFWRQFSIPRPLIIAMGMSVVLAISLLLIRAWDKGPSVPVVAIKAASSDTATQALARDLLVKLGNLRATQTDTLKLVQATGKDGEADFVLEVTGATRDDVATANLMLVGSRDRALLWSKGFERPAANQGDLKQQMAITAAKVLECALEARAAEGGRLSQDTVKLYLNGCSAHSGMMGGDDSRALIPVFRQVVAKAPRFEAAWSKLLYVEGDIVFSGDLSGEAERMKEPLQRHVAEARKLNPDMPAVLLAEADFAPPQAYARRMQLLRRAVDRNPESPEALTAYSSYLLKVGRAFDAVDAAKRATQLDPLSPVPRDALITALLYSNQIEPALEELRKAEELWPGASNLLAARYRLHLRYGDPHEALRIQRLGHYGGEHRDAFLRARINPSPANIEEAVSHPRRWFRQYPEAVVELAQVLGAFGREEELFPILLNWNHPDKSDWITDVLFRPALRNLRRDRRMMAVAKRLGLLDYWRASGKWPDFCLEPDLAYDCKKEAAKLA